jgi:phosphoglucosamine mutase
LQEAVLAAEAAMAGSGRVLVRASGTEPLLRVMVEAAHQADVNHWCAHLASLADRHLNPA